MVQGEGELQQFYICSAQINLLWILISKNFVLVIMHDDNEPKYKYGMHFLGEHLCVPAWHVYSLGLYKLSYRLHSCLACATARMCASLTVTHCSTVTVHCFSLQRGVCDRAFAPNTSQENNECHQNCLSGTLCEDMCDATSSLPSSRGNHNAEANKWHNPHCAIWAGAVVLC